MAPVETASDRGRGSLCLVVVRPCQVERLLVELGSSRQSEEQLVFFDLSANSVVADPQLELGCELPDAQNW